MMNDRILCTSLSLGQAFQYMLHFACLKLVYDEPPTWRVLFGRFFWVGMGFYAGFAMNGADFGVLERGKYSGLLASICSAAHRSVSLVISSAMVIFDWFAVKLGFFQGLWLIMLLFGVCLQEPRFCLSLEQINGYFIDFFHGSFFPPIVIFIDMLYLILQFV